MKKAILITFLAMLLMSCATPRIKLENLRLGMSKIEVLRAIGKPYAVRNSSINPKDGKTYEIWEYRQTGYDPIWWTPINDEYSTVFADGHLIRWGPPQDFWSKPDAVNEIRLR